MARHVVAAVNELPPGTRKFLEIDGRPIAVFNIKGEYFGLLNRCPHQGAALCKGALAPCPPSIPDRRREWWARFALPTLRYRNDDVRRAPSSAAPARSAPARRSGRCHARISHRAW